MHHYFQAEWAFSQCRYDLALPSLAFELNHRFGLLSNVMYIIFTAIGAVRDLFIVPSEVYLILFHPHPLQLPAR